MVILLCGQHSCPVGNVIGVDRRFELNFPLSTDVKMKCIKIIRQNYLEKKSDIFVIP